MDPADAMRLIGDAFPDLRPVALRPLGRGWDHQVFVVNEAWVFRFPRNEAAVSALALERVMAPWLAPQLTLPIPVPELFATIASHGADFAGHRLLRGATILDLDLDAPARASLAPALGAFVGALHAVPSIEAPAPLPPDPLGRFDRDRRVDRARGHLAAFARQGLLASRTAGVVSAILDDLPERPPSDRDVVVHADLHAANLVIDAGRLGAVIDWTDLHHGDRALDLAAAFEVIPPRALGAFLAAHGPVSETILTRARWRAADRSTHALAGSLERGDDRMLRDCVRRLTEMADAEG